MAYLVLGYFANEKWLYEQVIDRQLAHEALREECDSEEEYRDAVIKYRVSAMHYLADILRHEVGIPELCLEVAWVARNLTMFCWRLPERMRSTRRIPEDDDKLRKFYNTTNVGNAFEEPRDVALADWDMPRSIPKEVPPSLQATGLSSFLWND